MDMSMVCGQLLIRSRSAGLMKRAQLVAVWVADIGEIGCAGGGFARAGRVLAGGAAIDQCGGVDDVTHRLGAASLLRFTGRQHHKPDLAMSLEKP